jgi:hypothetical protein
LSGKLGSRKVFVVLLCIRNGLTEAQGSGGYDGILPVIFFSQAVVFTQNTFHLKSKLFKYP